MCAKKSCTLHPCSVRNDNGIIYNSQFTIDNSQCIIEDLAQFVCHNEGEMPIGIFP